MSRIPQRGVLLIVGRGPLSWALALVLGIVLLLSGPRAFAQAGPTPTLDQINAVARELYCPLCNGVRLDTCDLQACIQMRQVIADKLAAGVPKEQIKQEFVAEYGPKVLGEPPRSGVDLLAWIVPIVAIVAGAAWLVITARRWTRQPATAPAAPSAATSPQPLDDTAPLGSGHSPGTDPYLAQIEADLRDLD